MAGPYRFPASSTIYQDISGAAVDAESTAIMGALDASGWGSGLGIDVSFTILTADASVARRTFTSSGDEPDCDTAPIPLPSGGNIEGNPNYHCADGGDCHLLVYQGTRLYELYQADVSTGSATGGTFTGSCEVVWDLTHDYWQPMAPPTFSRGDHCNGADAADIPMAALILTSSDVTSGEITHALRFTMPNSLIQKSVYVHPATHIGGPTGVGPTFLPYGARLRLRGDYDLSKLPSDAARTVARALQKYGMFMADGGNLFVSATVGVENVVATSALRSLKATDFQMVDGGSRYTWSDYRCQRTPVTN
jgi:serine/threonine-protein kinase